MSTDHDVLLQIQTLITQQLAPSVTPIAVAAGANLQAAINAAAAGSTLVVAPGDYAPITLTKPLILRTSATLPARRIVGTDDPGLFVRIQATSVPAVSFVGAPATLVGFRMTRTDAAPPVVAIRGDWSAGTASLDQCWILGTAAGQGRGIEANGWATSITRTRVENIFAQGQDAQALCGWTGPGPLTVDDCYLEGSTETLMLGGADPTDAAHQPQNFTLKNSLLTKRLAWKGVSGLVKNGLELKNVKGFLVDGCTVEYAWVDGQIGFLLVLTPRNQDGTAPYSTVANGVIQNCLFRHGAGGANLLGADNNKPSGRLANVKLLNNRFEDVDPTAYGGNGRLLQISGGPDQIAMDRNTFVGAMGLNSFITFGNFGDVLRCTNFSYTNNIADEGYYGLIGDNLGCGKPASDYFTPGAVYAGNQIVKQAPGAINYPSGFALVASEAAGVLAGAGSR